MKILYTPVLIVPSLTPPDHARILEAAGPGATLVEATDPARQRAEIVDAEVLFGREVARRALGFGMGVLAVDIEDVSPEPGVDAIWKPDRLHEMLGLSDVVVIALPLTKATHHLFTRDLFRRMRPAAILINVTRGAIVYDDDLLTALNDGLIWGAGLDVTDPEPLPPGHPLWTHPRVIVTPHTAGGSPRRAGRVLATFCENLRRLRAGQPLLALIDKRKGY